MFRRGGTICLACKTHSKYGCNASAVHLATGPEAHTTDARESTDLDICPACNAEVWLRAVTMSHSHFGTKLFFPLEWRHRLLLIIATVGLGLGLLR